MPILTDEQWLILAAILVTVAIILVIVTIVRRYVRVPPDQALIVYGRRSKQVDPTQPGRTSSQGFRIVKGGGTFVLPVFESIKFLSLETNTIEIRVPEVITKEGVPLTVEGVAQVKVRGDDVSIRTAAEQILSKTEDEVRFIIQKTLEGHIRGVCAQMTVEDINANRDELSQKIQTSVGPDMDAMGMHMIVFVIRDIRDEVGYLSALGKKRTAEVKKDAEVGEALAMREQTIRVAQANKDGEIGKAEAARDQTILVAQAYRDGAVEKAKRDAEIAEAEKERDIKIAMYAAEVKKQQAARDLAYDIQQSIVKQTLVKEQVQVEIEERRKQVELQEQEIAKQEKALIAEKVIPAQRQADANVALAEGEAKKMQALAEGEKKKMALTGEGEAAKIRAIAEAEAYRIRITGEAEAAKVLAIGTAEAEAMKKKAEAWRQYGDAAKAQMIIDKLPELASAMAKPLENTEKIILMGSEGGMALVSTTAKALSALPPIVESLTGISLPDLIKGAKDIATAAATKGAEEIAESRKSGYVPISNQTLTQTVKIPKP